MAAIDQAADIQALVKTGFGNLGARFVLLRVADRARAREWLRSLAKRVTSVADTNGIELLSACQIAFTANGLRALGMRCELVETFAPEFVDGIAGDERRSHRLGDEGVNAPGNWKWGTGDKEPHVLVMLFGEAASGAFPPANSGCEPDPRSFVATDMDHREPFGFVDGISQPELDWNGKLRPGGARDRDYRTALAAGEVLLGHGNEYGQITRYPEANGLGRNGSYLVYRQLQQDVTGFWRWLAEVAGPEGAVALSEKMVGRGIDGDPLPGLEPAVGGADVDPRNAFLFRNDPDGAICPVGSHIRRANPRTGDDPLGRRGFLKDLLSSVGLSGTAKGDAIASTRFHRIVRRGRPYGTTLSPAEAMKPGAPPVDAGLHFISLNANIARQFEFIQGAWAASATFAGLAGEQDPLLGNRVPFPDDHATDAFSYASATGCPRLATGLPRFVTVVGGAYFFLPGLGGLAQILAD